VAWLGSPHQEFFGFPMVCFCDIPIGRIAEHVGFYGSYGIGMSRDWALRNGLNPVAYYSRSSPVCQEYLGAIRGAQDILKKTRKTRLSGTFTPCSHTQNPYLARWLRMAHRLQKEFYLESEWRYVPRLSVLAYPINRKIMDDTAKRDALNAAATKRDYRSPRQT